MVYSPEDIVEAEGLAALGGAEVVVLGSLSTQIRSCVATCGSGGGAAARGDCWRYLFGFITIWLGQRSSPSACSISLVDASISKDACAPSHSLSAFLG